MKKSSVKQTQNLEPAKPPAATRITSLVQLSDICAAPLVVNFEIDGKPVEVVVRAITPREDSARSAILRAPQPRFIKGKTQAEDRFEYNDAAYVDAKEKAENTARAITIYRACPIVKESKPDLRTNEEITEYVQGLFNEHVLSLIYTTIVLGGVSVGQRANFTTGSDSPEN